VYCQLDYLGKCLPGRVKRALDELPATLDETYERTLQEIDDTNWEFAQRLIQCVAVVSRPLRVEELAEFLAFDFQAGQIPRFREDWRLEDPAEAVLSTCSALLSVVNVKNSQVIQFSHFSVKEFLTSVRFGEKRSTISSRYHVSMTSAHTLVAQACLGILLHLDKNITQAILPKFPLAEYAAEHWFEHARFEAVSQHVGEGMKQLFDREKPHLATWLWIFDPTVLSGRDRSVESPRTPDGTPLHYAAFCGLSDVVKFLAVEHSEDVNSQNRTGKTPLHLNSQRGNVDVARLLIEHGADAAAQDTLGFIPLHQASERGHVDLARLLIGHGANAAAQSKYGWTPLHQASARSCADMARLLIEHGADAAVQGWDGWTPLHVASSWGRVDLARLLIEHGADVAAWDKYNGTPLHMASEGGYVDVARLLIEHGADVAAGGHVDISPLIEDGANAAAQDEHRSTPLHRASEQGHVDLAQFLIVHGADVSAQDSDGWTPIERASSKGHLDLVRLLIQHGASAVAQDEHKSTPLHRASEQGHADLARLLIEHGADASAQDSEGWTPIERASSEGHLDLARLLVQHGADAAAQNKDGSTPLRLA